MNWQGSLADRVLVGALACMILPGCQALPSLQGRTSSSAILNTADTRLGRSIEPRTAAHPGWSGVYPLREGGDAFAARMRLAASAERSLDVQLGRAAPGTFLLHRLDAIIGQPGSEVDLVSPYFVPAATGVEDFAGMRARGVRVRILTNALEATDVLPVHAGYAKRRKPLLESGVVLYEMRTASGLTHRGGSFTSGGSGTSLHAKTFAVDRTHVYIGSFNFDPRSAMLNTELGFLIRSPALAQRIAAAFEGAVPANAYEVRLTARGALRWIERRDGVETPHDTEPGTRAWQRAAVWLLSLLPIEWML